MSHCGKGLWWKYCSKTVLEVSTQIPRCSRFPHSVSLNLPLLSIHHLKQWWIFWFATTQSINHDNAAALNLYVSRTRADLIDILLRSRSLDSNLASKAFAEIDSTASPQQNLEIASKLLQRGAHGRPLREALVYAVATNHIGTIKLLLSRSNPNRASVDYQGAQALRDAVSRKNIPIVDILLEAAPTNQSLSQTFPHIRKASKEGRFQLSKSFLKQGVQGLEVDRALSEAISDGPPMRDERLLQLLVDQRAAVDPTSALSWVEGTRYCSEFSSKDVLPCRSRQKQFWKPSNFPRKIEDFHLSACLWMQEQILTMTMGKPSLKLQDPFQLPSLDLLLQFSPKPSSLNAAFASTTAMNDIERRYASVDFEDGRALYLAIQKLLQQHVLLLLKMKPNSVSFSNGFLAARSLRGVQMEHRFHKLLLGNSIRKPSVTTVTSGFNAAHGLRNGSPKQEILDIILNTGVKRDSGNNALLNFVKSDNPDCSTISTLLTRCVGVLQQ